MRWRCPFCMHHGTLKSGVDWFTNAFLFSAGKHDQRFLVANVIVCPNDDCREFSMWVTLNLVRATHRGHSPDEPLVAWPLIPESNAKPLPDYIPAAIVADYREACLIRDKSPKASATLARRCLQGMIRDFWKVRKRTLAKEVESLKGRVDPEVWKAIEAVRKVGNIGAHMEKDINVIVDVEPEEAGLLIALMEQLVDDWYVRRHTHAQNLQSVTSLAATKEAQRRQQPAPDKPSGG
jgi:hypothetical protein